MARNMYCSIAGLVLLSVVYGCCATGGAQSGVGSLGIVVDGESGVPLTDWKYYREIQRELTMTTRKNRPTTRAFLEKYAAWNKEMIRRLNSGEIELSSFYDNVEGRIGNAVVPSEFFEDLDTFRGVVLFTPRGTGYANRAEGFMSAFLLAMSTGRVIFCDFGRQWPETEILERCPILPESYWSAFERKEELKALWIEKTHHGEEPTSERYSFENAHTVQPSNHFRTDKDMSERFENDLFLNFTANIFSGNVFFYNPFMRERLEHWFGPRSLANDYTHILAVWLLPMPVSAIKEAGLFAEEHLMTKDVVVGLHIRATESFAGNVPPELFFDCVDSVIPSHIRATDSYVIYLATDSAAVQREAKERWGDHVLWARDVVEYPSDRINLRLRTDIIGMYLDLQTLSLSTDLVVTGSSSFSRMAVSLANVAPKFVTYDSKIWCKSPLTESFQCVLAASSKICSNRYSRILSKQLDDEDQRELQLECISD